MRTSDQTSTTRAAESHFSALPNTTPHFLQSIVPTHSHLTSIFNSAPTHLTTFTYFNHSAMHIVAFCSGVCMVSGVSLLVSSARNREIAMWSAHRSGNAGEDGLCWLAGYIVHNTIHGRCRCCHLVCRLLEDILTSLSILV